MHAFPAAFTLSAVAESLPVPPRSVAYDSAAPSAATFTRNASFPPRYVVCGALDVVGKLVDDVYPATYTSPDAPTATPVAASVPLPPRYVPYVSCPALFSRTRKASSAPADTVRNTSAV